jgi:hypothetical protein
MPATAASAVPAAIWKAICVGRGDDEASAITAAASSTAVPPLGHADMIQKPLRTRITANARSPETPAASRLVFGT